MGEKIVADFLGPETEEAAVMVSSEIKEPNSVESEEDGDGLLAKAGSLFKNLFSSEPAEE